jgi:hypothetical protein
MRELAFAARRSVVIRRWLLPLVAGAVVGAALPSMALRGVVLADAALPGTGLPSTPLPAWANAGAAWRSLYVADDRSMEVALDLAGIRPRGSVVLAWVRFTYGTDQFDAHKAAYRSMLQLWAYECGGGRQALTQFAEFSGAAGAAGKVVASGARHSYDWSYPEPGTVGAAAMSIACSMGWRRSTVPQSTL